MLDSSEIVFHRNIGIMAHIDAGKTTTTERILYYTGKVHKIGEVDDGAATMDWMEQEQERGITITSATTSLSWQRNEKEYSINIIDTPGHVDFTVEVERSLRVLDGGVAIFCGVAGVQPQTETVWRQADKYRVPRIVFVNKMDRIGANFFNVVEMIEQHFYVKALPIQIPVGSGSEFRGIVDIIDQQQVMFDEESKGIEVQRSPIEDSLIELALHSHEKLLESLSEFDDEILESLLEEKVVEPEKVKQVLRKETLANKVVPVLCGSSLKNKGVQPLLDGIIDYLPSPMDLPPVEDIQSEASSKENLRYPKVEEPFSSIAFKIANDPFAGQLTFIRVYSGSIATGDHIFNATQRKGERIAQIVKMHSNKRTEVEKLIAGDIGALVGLNHTITGDTLCDKRAIIVLEQTTFPEPVIDVAIEPRTTADREKLEQALEKLTKEDPSFRSNIDPDTGQIIISGMGELHLDIIIERLLKEFKVSSNVGKPRVSYRETLTGATIVEDQFDRRLGGKEQFAKCKLRLNSREKGSGFEFRANVPAEVPPEYIKSVELGVLNASSSGVIAGYPMIDFSVSLEEIEYNERSSEIAFQMLASQLFREGVQKANPSVMEPMMKVEVRVPLDYMGEVIHDLNSRRAKIRGMEEKAGSQEINVDAPLSEMFGYSTSLRSLTQGRAVYTMQFSHYEPVENS